MNFLRNLWFSRTMSDPPERDRRSPEVTRAEDEPRSVRSVLVIVALVVILAGTIFVTLEVRRRRMGGRPEAGTSSRRIDDPASLGLPSMAVAAEIQSVAHRIASAWERDGKPPDGLDALPPDDDDPPANPDSPAKLDPPLDYWRHPYVLRRSEGENGVVLTLLSYGSDGAPGGTGDAQDLEMEIRAPEGNETGEG